MKCPRCPATLMPLLDTTESVLRCDNCGFITNDTALDYINEQYKQIVMLMSDTEKYTLKGKIKELEEQLNKKQKDAEIGSKNVDNTVSIETLLRACQGQYRYATKSDDGKITLWVNKPRPCEPVKTWAAAVPDMTDMQVIRKIAITEFQEKHWKDCFYELKPSEQDWIGCVGYFWNEDETCPFFGILDAIYKGANHPYRKQEGGKQYEHFRPATSEEIKIAKIY